MNDLADYCIRDGGDKKPGIYLREYNVRLATFNANTAALQKRLAELFDEAHMRSLRTWINRPERDLADKIERSTELSHTLPGLGDYRLSHCEKALVVAALRAADKRKA